jgi:hypothetical protein
MPDSSLLDAQLTYESLGSLNLDAAIASLDTALSNYNSSGYIETIGKDFGGSDISCRENISSAQLRKECDENPSCKSYNLITSWNGGCLKNKTGPLVPNNLIVYYEKTSRNSSEVESAFAPIADYYSKLVSINDSLRKYINKTAQNIGDSDPRLINEERYSNRVYPEESVMPREASYGFFPELRQSSLPYLISFSVFMATLSIFLIFQINGFSGQINVPPSISAWFASPAASAVPFYQDPMVLGGIAIIGLSGMAIFAILYFQAKNTNRSRQ